MRQVSFVFRASKHFARFTRYIFDCSCITLFNTNFEQQTLINDFKLLIFDAASY